MALSAPLAPAVNVSVGDASPADVSPADAPRRLWTRAEYYRMAEVGLLDSDERVELLDGELFIMPPQLTPHASSVYFTTEALRARFGAGFVVRPQLPITLGLRSEPEPDICVARGTGFDYADHHPGPGEIILVVEVSDSTLRKDRTRKVAAYARAGLPEYWIVNVMGRQMEVYRGPQSDGSYALMQTLEPGEDVLPLSASPDTAAVRVDELLAPVRLESER